MQDMLVLMNSRNLKSWRTWESQAYQRSGFLAALVAVPMLTVAFVLACTLYGRALGHIAAPVVLAGGGFFLATVVGLMAFATLRLNAWKRANPWTPPPQRSS